MTMWNSKILRLLSQHRQSEQRALPAVLSQTQITNLLRQTLDPNQEDNQISNDVQRALRELEAQNEVLRAPGNRYCVAPPVLLSNSEDLAGLQFRGDRAYLTLAHEVLKTNQPVNVEQLRSTRSNFKKAKDDLLERNISLLTIAHILNDMPEPQKPQRIYLKGREYQLSIIEFWKTQDIKQIKQYVPAHAEQVDRWVTPIPSTPKTQSLFQVADNEYLWYEEKQFYALERDTAVLAMFYLDKWERKPIRLVLEDTGQMDLRRVILPNAHYQLFRYLAEQKDGERRVYYVPPANRQLVRDIFKHLGCDLR